MSNLHCIRQHCWILYFTIEMLKFSRCHIFTGFRTKNMLRATWNTSKHKHFKVILYIQCIFICIWSEDTYSKGEINIIKVWIENDMSSLNYQCILAKLSCFIAKGINFYVWPVNKQKRTWKRFWFEMDLKPICIWYFCPLDLNSEGYCNHILLK